MKDEVFIAIISGGMALLGVGIAQWFELKKRKSEEDRWYANYFLPKKFDALYSLYAELQKSYGSLSIYRFRKLRDESEFQSFVTEDVNRFAHSYYLARIYLQPETIKSIDKFQEAMKEAGIYIYTRVAPITIDRDGEEVNVTADWPEEFDNLYKHCVGKVGTLLNPEFLQNLERKKKT